MESDCRPVSQYQSAPALVGGEIKRTEPGVLCLPSMVWDRWQCRVRGICGFCQSCFLFGSLHFTAQNMELICVWKQRSPGVLWDRGMRMNRPWISRRAGKTVNSAWFGLLVKEKRDLTGGYAGRLWPRESVTSWRAPWRGIRKNLIQKAQRTCTHG